MPARARKAPPTPSKRMPRSQDRLYPPVSKAQLAPITLNLNLDGRTLGTAMSEIMADMFKFSTQAPAGGHRGDILLTLRAIVDSEGNGPEALLEPILCAVHSVCRPDFTVKGLAFIEAFDRVDLRALLQQMRDLKCFTKSDLCTYFAAAIRSRLGEIFGPDEAPAPSKKPPAKRKTDRPSWATERTWTTS